MPPLPAPPVTDHFLPYLGQLETRPVQQVDLVVIHCTELPDLATAREYGERVLYPSGTGNSGHYYIDRDGHTARYVPEDRVAHHVRGYNARSIGIELVNRGRWPHWLDSRHQAMDEAYPPVQVEALVDLLQRLAGTLPALRLVAGHEDLDRETVPASDNPAILVPRKRDPGPRFPWAQVLATVPLQRLLP